ncbi:hypothetical protein AAF712_009628 [Marasmius tenuissimus]|uniref:Uncharacterized protein n=1 Tax=Marasmius tenuissimus TaxID=585030 RepID=A0ABR2ZQH3_9AGAR
MSFAKRLDGTAKKLSKLTRSRDDREEKIEGILHSVCSIVRELVASSAVGKEEKSALVENAHGILNDGIEWCYGDEDSGIDFIASFAHTEGTLLDNGEDKLLGSINDEAYEQLLSIFTRMVPNDKKSELVDNFRKERPRQKPWWETPIPHPKTTPLSRFREEGTLSQSPVPPESSAQAFSLYQAMAEISADQIISPSSPLCISADNQFIAVAGAGGYKNRSPYLSFSHLNESSTSDFSASTVELGFGDIANHIALDDVRKLVWVSDGDRVKSYTWGPGTEDRRRKGLLPTHTLSCPSGVEGPIMVRESRIIQGGKGKIAYWNVEDLKTHGPDGKQRIGKAISTEDTWRDDYEEIETSSGSKAGGTIQLQDQPSFSIQTWHPLPTCSSQVLCASDVQSDHDYSLISVDLESGKRVGRYLGHGGTITYFSSDPVSEPNTFLTACSDTYARLYDCRQPLPVLTFEAENGGFCHSAVYAHPNGLPFVFTGGTKSEVIRLWDVRARRLVYELSTGNTSVEGLAWDSQRNTLYAATECSYLGRMGDHYGYRIAKRPKPPQEALARARGNDPKFKKTKTVYRGNSDDDEDEDGDEDMEEEVEYWEDYNTEYEEEEEEEEDFYEAYETKCWPSKAHHPENYFRRMHDAGEHCLYRYKFATDVDPGVYPGYGQAALERDSYW